MIRELKRLRNARKRGQGEARAGWGRIDCFIDEIKYMMLVHSLEKVFLRNFSFFKCELCVTPRWIWSNCTEFSGITPDFHQGNSFQNLAHRLNGVIALRHCNWEQTLSHNLQIEISGPDSPLVYTSVNQKPKRDVNSAACTGSVLYWSHVRVWAWFTKDRPIVS